MGKSGQPKVAVKLSEADWLAILGILEPACKARGDAWATWGEYVMDRIKTKCRKAATKRQVAPSAQPEVRMGTHARGSDDEEDDWWSGSDEEKEYLENLGDVRDDGTPYGWDPCEHGD